MWYDESVFYQIFPLGLCGAPHENDGVLTPRILKILEWIPQITKIGANAVYFSPVFDADSHGYDTRDYTKIDCRLGSNADFAKVCTALHDAGIKVVLDGVFNHVGRGFWAFQDVLRNRENSPYKDWFQIDLNGNSNYNDGLWYEGWEGHYELVKLNVRNDAVVQYLFDCIRGWVKEFDIDGLRLDVAYCLDENFVRRLHDFTNGLKPEFLLLGEMLHGDYNRMMNGAMLNSVTNYECYKGLFSGFNS
ncbi:MAG: alpha-amylase family glycosyl hydrolase, partial [Ruthenibacterium sp.]